MTDSSCGCVKENYSTLFEDKCAFRKLCEYLGIPTTEHACTKFTNELDKDTLEKAVKKYGLTMPVLVQNRNASGNGESHAVVIGKTSDSSFLTEIRDHYGNGTEVILSRFRDPCIPVSISASVEDVNILIKSVCVDLHIPDRTGDNFILKYHGFDVDAFEDCRKSHPFFSDIAKDLERSATRICKALQLRGFGGNLSIDAIISGAEVRFVSINNCDKESLAQAAIECLRKYIETKKNTDDKAGENTDKNLLPCIERNLEAKGSTVSVILYDKGSSDSAAPNEKRFNEYIKRISGLPVERLACVERKVIGLLPDGNTGCIAFCDNIVSINIGKVVFNPNLLPMSEKWEKTVLDAKDPLALKLELINRGIRSDKREYGKPVVYNLDCGKGLISVKVSAEERIASLSPYTISDETLMFFDTEVAKVISEERTDRVEPFFKPGETIFKDICEVEDGTLRVRHCSGCKYARDNVGCRYCKYTTENFKMCDFDKDDIKEAVRKFKDLRDEGKVSFDRAVIGGGCISTPHKTVLESIINTAKSINDTFGNTDNDVKLPIILACPPPSIQTDMDLFKKNGIHGIVISVEVFDPPKSKECLPGKDRVPLSAFYYTLRHAVFLWGWENVYSNLIPGLEDPRMTREGCGQIASTGARPVISPFRPIAGTGLQDVMPLPAEVLYKLCNDVLNDYYSFHQDMDTFDETDNCGPFDMTRNPETVVMPIKKPKSDKSQEVKG